MDILKNDVIAILSEKINSKLARNGQSSTFPPGPDKQISLPTSHWHIWKTWTLEKVCSSKNQKSFLLEHLEKGFRVKSLQFTLVLWLPFWFFRIIWPGIFHSFWFLTRKEFLIFICCRRTKKRLWVTTCDSGIRRLKPSTSTRVFFEAFIHSLKDLYQAWK